MLAKKSYSIYIPIYVHSAVYLNIKAPQLLQFSFLPNIYSKFYISMVLALKTINCRITKQFKAKNNWIQTLLYNVVKITVQPGPKIFTVY